MSIRGKSASGERDGLLPAGLLAAGALALATLLWAGNFIAGRALRDDIDPLTLNTLRWVICLLVFLPLVGRRLLEHRQVMRREWRFLTALGVTGIAAFQTMVYSALSHTTAVNALLMLSLTPGTILLGTAILGTSRPTALQWLGSAISLVGALVLITRLDPTVITGLSFNPGDLWMLGAILAWAIYSVLLQRRPADLPQDVTLASSIAIALVLLVPAALVVGPAAFGTGGPIEPSFRVIGSLLYIAVFASLVAYLLWSYGVTVLGPERAGQFVHLMPVFGTVLAILLLGEAILLAQVAGAICIFAGIVLVNRKGRSAA